MTKRPEPREQLVFPSSKPHLTKEEMDASHYRWQIRLALKGAGEAGLCLEVILGVATTKQGHLSAAASSVGNKAIEFPC